MGEGEAPHTYAPVHLKPPLLPGPPSKSARVELHDAAFGDERAALKRRAKVCTALRSVENYGGNRMRGRSVAVKQCDVLGHEVGGRRRLGSLRGVRMRLGSEGTQGSLRRNVPDTVAPRDPPGPA